MADRKRRYYAYLLRLWPEQSGGQFVWRASLEDPHTGIRRGFANLAQLFAYLEAQSKEDGRKATHPPD